MGATATEAAEDGAAVAGGALGLGLGETVRELREAYECGRTRSVAWRRAQLRGLLRLLEEKEAEAFQALRTDLGKHHAEAYRDEVTSIAGIQPSPLHLPLLCFFLTAFVPSLCLIWIDIVLGFFFLGFVRSGCSSSPPTARCSSSANG